MSSRAHSAATFIFNYLPALILTADISEYGSRTCVYVLAIPVLPIFTAQLSENTTSGVETGSVTKIFALACNNYQTYNIPLKKELKVHNWAIINAIIQGTIYAPF